MGTYGPHTALSFASDSGPLGGTIAWDSDGPTLEATFAHGMQSTEALIYTDFGFSIPTDETIVGVYLEFETKSKVSGSTEVYDDTVKLWVSSAVAGTNKAGSYFYSASSYGGASDVWGATLTPALVNSSGFGFVLIASLESGSTTRIRVENPSMTIYTTGGDGGGPGPCEVDPFEAEPGSITGYDYDGLTEWDDLTLTSTKAEKSARLVFDQFNLALNFDAEDQIITGVQIDIVGKAVASGTVTDHMVQLIFGGIHSTGDYKSGGSWATTTTYGGPGDLWGLDEITLTDMSMTGSGFFIQGLSAGAAEYSVESATITVYTGSGLDNCGNKRGYCVPLGTGTATGKLVEVQVSADGDDGGFTGGYWGNALLFGYMGSVP